MRCKIVLLQTVSGGTDSHLIRNLPNERAYSSERFHRI
jgi:hypothetical protein